MIRYENYVESLFNDWQQIDMITSRDCTLRCTYCYLTKSKDSLYDMNQIIEGLDKTLAKALKDDKEGVVLSFFPEPWVNISRSNELITRSLETLLKYPKYVTNFMIMIGTNGVNLTQPIPVLENIKDHLSLSVSLDGVQEQHDMYRVFPDGSPSWEIVKNNIKKFKDDYEIKSTKVTLGPDTLKYIYESSLFLWDEMKLNDINMNVVFENLWGDESSLLKSLGIFEEQLKLLLEDILKNRRWEKQQFQGLLGYRNIPSPDRNISKNRTYCGALSMRSIDSDGRVYPCFRLNPYSINDDDSFDIYKLGSQVIRSLKLLNNFDSMPKKCAICNLHNTCAMCVGGAYEEFNSIFGRTTYHCEFIKLQSIYSQKLHEGINEAK